MRNSTVWLKALRFLLKGFWMTHSSSDSLLANFWRNHKTFIAETTFVVVVFFWGITFVFSKAALDVVGPFAYNTMRMTLATLTLALLVGRDWRHVNRTYFWPAVITGFILFLSYATQAYGIQFTTASKAGFLTGTNLVYVPIFSALLLRRVPSWTAITGVVLAFVGLYLISFEGTLGNLTLSHGDFWVAVSGVGWALYLIALSNYSPRLNVVLFSALHVGVTALLSGIGWVFSAEPLTLPLTSSALWLAGISTGVLVIGLGTSVETWVARLVSPTRLALIAALEPVFAALAGWWVGEVITLRIIIGGTLIIAGMLVAESRHFFKREHTMPKTIQTQRLNLIPLTLEQLQLFLTDLHRLEDEVGFAIDRDNDNDTARRAINIKISKMGNADPAQHPWFTYWLIVIAGKSMGAGMAGFKGSPNEKGKVEIGYGLAPQFRRRGFTTEAVEALIEWAFQHQECLAIQANTDPLNIVSQRVLEKVGMTLVQKTDEALFWRIDKTST